MFSIIPIKTLIVSLNNTIRLGSLHRTVLSLRNKSILCVIYTDICLKMLVKCILIRMISTEQISRNSGFISL